MKNLQPFLDYLYTQLLMPGGTMLNISWVLKSILKRVWVTHRLLAYSLTAEKELVPITGGIQEKTSRTVRKRREVAFLG